MSGTGLIVIKKVTNYVDYCGRTFIGIIYSYRRGFPYMPLKGPLTSADYGELLERKGKQICSLSET